MILPLPLVPFERYMLADDRPWLPMAFDIRLTFSGTLDSDRFAQALRQALSREPLLTARLAGDALGNLRWEAGPDEPPYLDCQPHGAPLLYPGTASIDLRRESGLRVWVRHGDGHVEARFQFHHSCSDGIGAYRFLDDVLRFYDRLTRPGSTVEPHNVDPALLARRTDFGLSWPVKALRQLVDLFGLTVGSANFFLRRPEQLAAPEQLRIDEEQLRHVVEMPARTLCKESVASLAALAKAARVTLNDLLTTELIYALRDWQQQVTGRPLRGFLRVMIPMNLRTAEHRRAPATNIVAMVPIDRGKLMLARPRWALWFVSLEMRYLKTMRFGLTFLSMLRAYEILLGGLARLLNVQHCQSTTSFSNVGRVFQDSTLPRIDGHLTAGDLVLETVASAPPFRPFTPVSISTVSYNGGLTIGMSYDRQVFNHQAASDLIDLIQRRLEARAAA